MNSKWMNNPMFDLGGKTAIITGAGSGIGRAMAIAFAHQGCAVCVLDANADSANETVSIVQTNGGTATAYHCDVTDQQGVNEVVKKIAAQGPIDILINNAGIPHVGNAEITSPEDFNRIFDVNVKGIYHCLQACLPFMKTNGGSIINMSSIAAVTGIPDRFAYSMSKGAVVGMTLSVAKDYLTYNIRCNCISPGRVHTPFVDAFISKNYPGSEAEMFARLSRTQPIGRMGEPEEVAALAVYLCSNEASFITGTDYPIDGGFIRLNN